jgi:uncharacterized protein
MIDPSSPFLERIAAALERLSAPPVAHANITKHDAYRWDGNQLRAVTNFRALPAHLITGVDRQKAELAQILARHSDGLPAHDVLLWGARGTGKSVLVKSLIAELLHAGKPIAIVESAADAVRSLPILFAQIESAARRFVVFVDDIAFEGASDDARIIRSMLDGGVEARPANVRLIVTSNRRNIVARSMEEHNNSSNPRDGEEDSLALADRFGIKLGFQKIDQATYLAMVLGYSTYFGLSYEENAALQFAHQRGGQSGRTAWHFIVECAGREGKMLDY